MNIFTFQNLYNAYLDCRRKKRNKLAAIAFEMNKEQNLLLLQQELIKGIYAPSRSFCFISKNDKYREVFAADFRDRVIHHFLVGYLEEIWEKVFIHDSYACRKGKGTKAAVDRLQSFSRQVTKNQSCHAWFLQLDIRSFFPSIDRQILLDLVLSRLENEELRKLISIVIMHDPTQNPIFTCPVSEWTKIPKDKSLFGVTKGKGLPIGNLTSQFFANVYLNPLDQFIKHVLKVQYYLRYVDDFILLHTDREKLVLWQKQIAGFLQDQLRLQLHPHRQYIRPVSNGMNFVGYIVRPSHKLVRRRVVETCKKKIGEALSTMTKETSTISSLSFPPKQYDRLFSTINSYLGYFRHASGRSLRDSLWRKFPKLSRIFMLQNFQVSKRWILPFHAHDLYTQFSYFRSHFSGIIVFQVGCYLELLNRDAIWAQKELGLKKLRPRKGFYARAGIHQRKRKSFFLKLAEKNVLVVAQNGKIGQNVLDRTGVCIWYDVR